jgi:hypothetical protein
MVVDWGKVYRSLPRVRELQVHFRELPVVALVRSAAVSRPPLEAAILQAGYSAKTYVIVHPRLARFVEDSASAMMGSADWRKRIEILVDDALHAEDPWFVIGGDRVVCVKGHPTPFPMGMQMMRIRIIQRPTISHVDGIRVDCYRVGSVYDVNESLGEIFLAEEWAEPASTQRPRFRPPPPLYSKA